MEDIKVLVVDDSSFARSLICETLSSDPHIKVVGEAKNGRSAVELSSVLKPDLITMDLTMPDMDGLEAIRLIMHRLPTPILVITSKADAQSGFAAIAAGALEVFDKANIANSGYDSLLYKVRFLAKVRVIRHLQNNKVAPMQGTSLPACSSVDVVGIASSTGGPKALSLLLSSLPSSFDRPIFIAQHIGKQFDQGLATFLQRTTKKNVVLAEAGMKISRAVIYIAPAGSHLIIQDTTIVLSSRKPQDMYVPSANNLFASLAKEFRSRAVAIVLTGMGDDGAEGASQIALQGGVVIAQDEQTSAVFGMPKAVIDRNIAHKVLPLDKIGTALVALACKERQR